jgi:hypothetical protein
MGSSMSRGGSLDPEELAWIRDKTGKSANIIKEVHAEFRWELIIKVFTIWS